MHSRQALVMPEMQMLSLLVCAKSYYQSEVQASDALAKGFSATDVFEDPLWLPTAFGAGIGIAFTVLNRFGRRRFWREPQGPLRVVITGSTRGIGKALARALLKYAAPFSN